MCKGDEQRPLRDSARETLKGYLKLLDEIRRQLAGLTRQLRKTVSTSAEGERWRSLPGISWVLAYTILAEVGCCDRFAGCKQLSSYALLAPRADDSGEEDDQTPQGRHVGHAGRKTLKWAFIEAAHGATRKSAYFRALFDRRTNGGQRDKNRGYIAVGHELCRIGFSCCRNQRDYSEERPQRPGSPPQKPSPAIAPPIERKKKMQLKRKSKAELKGKESIQEKRNDPELRQASRPGTGGSEHPMVAAAPS